MTDKLIVSSFSGELDLFRPLGCNVTSCESSYVNFLPIGFNPGSTQPLEFIASGPENLFTDLENTQLHLKVKLTKSDGTNMNEDPDDGDFDFSGPVQYTAHTLFSQVDCWLNGTAVTKSLNTYAYKAVIEATLEFSNQIKSSQLESALWHGDAPTVYDVLIQNARAPNGDPLDEFRPTCTNAGLFARWEVFREDKTVDLYMSPHLSILTTDRYLIPGVECKLRFSLNSPAFYLMNQAAGNYKLQIQEASLITRYVRLLPSVNLKIESMLKTHPAIYPLKASEVRTFNLAVGCQNGTWEGVSSGEVPEVLVVALVDNRRFAGTKTLNAFKFEHFGLSSINLTLDARSVPFKPMTFAEDNDFLCAFNRVFTELGLGNHRTNSLERKYFKDHYAFFCFNLKPAGGDSTIPVAPRQGSLRLEFTFRQPLARTVTVLAHTTFTRILQIDSQRKVTYDLK